MNENLIITLNELERVGLQKGSQGDTKEKGLNITHETGEFLRLLILATHAKDILEISVSNGYSTLWLAEAAKTNKGSVSTIYQDQCDTLLAKQNLAEAELERWVNIIVEKPEEYFKNRPTFDFIFLDSYRDQYVDWWVYLRECVRPGGLIVVDNAISHVSELTNFISLVKVTPGFLTSIMPLGNGELIIWRERND